MLDNRRFDGCRIGRREARRLRRRIYGEMIRRDPKKYLAWVAGLVLGTKLFLWKKELVEIMVSIYCAMRKIDDRVDRDALLPDHCSSAIEYVENCLRFIEDRSMPSDDVEYLLAYALDLAHESGLDLNREVWSVIDSMRFDATRIDAAEMMVLPRRALFRYQYGRDGRGVIMACLKLADELKKGVRYRHLKWLCWGVRVSYDLRDLEQDIRVGFCNICAEDVEFYALPLPKDLSPHSIQMWRRYGRVHRWVLREAQGALEALDIHQDLMAQEPLKGLSWRTVKVLYVMYERPARKRLQRILEKDGW